MLAGPSPYIHRVTLQPGMGLLCNNVLHDRSAFTDDPARPRLIYRARYYDRIAVRSSMTDKHDPSQRALPDIDAQRLPAPAPARMMRR